MGVPMIIFSVYAFCWAALIIYSYNNRKQITVGDLVLGAIFAPLAFIVCYADWNTVVIRWRE